MRGLFFGVAGIFMLLAAGTARAELPYEGMYCGEGDESKCVAWWNRRTKAQQAFILALPVEDRHQAVTCMFLLGFPKKINNQLRDCTHKAIINHRAGAACEADGHELLSVAMRDCREAWEKDYGAAHRP